MSLTEVTQIASCMWWDGLSSLVLESGCVVPISERQALRASETTPMHLAVNVPISTRNAREVTSVRQEFVLHLVQGRGTLS